MGWLSDAFDFVGNILGDDTGDLVSAGLGVASPWLSGLLPGQPAMTPEQQQLLEATTAGRQQSMELANQIISQGLTDPDFYRGDQAKVAALTARTMEGERRRQVSKGVRTPFTSNDFNRDRFMRMFQAMAGLNAPERALSAAGQAGNLLNANAYTGPSGAQAGVNLSQQQQLATVLDSLGALGRVGGQPAQNIIWNTPRQLPGPSVTNVGSSYTPTAGGGFDIY